MLKKLATYFFLCLAIQLYSQQKLDIQYTDAYKKAEVYLKLLQEKYYEGDYKLHKVYSDSLYIISKENNLEKFEIKAMVNQAINLNLQGKYQKAIEIYREALIIAERIPEDKHTEVLILVNLGNTYNNVELYHKSIETMNKVLEKADYSEKPDLINVAALNGLSKSYSYLGEEEKALFYAQKVRKIGEKTGNENIILTSLNHISNSYYKLGEYEKSITTAEKAFEYKAFEKSTKTKAWLLVNLGVANEKLKAYTKAEEYLKQALEIAKDKKISEIEMICYKSLLEIYKTTNKKEALAEVEKKYNEAKISHLNNQKGAVTEELKAEIVDKDKKISAQEKTVALLSKQQKIVFWVSLIIVIVLGTLFWRYRKKYKNKDEELIEVVAVNEDTQLKETEKYKNSSLSDEDISLYKEKIIKITEEDEVYLSHDLTQANFAQKIGLSSQHLSEVLYFGFNKNFYQFINYYRINEAKKILESSTNKELKILAVAFDSGFKSKTTFNRVFKEQTGLTPTQYRKKGDKSGSTR